MCLVASVYLGQEIIFLQALFMEQCQGWVGINETSPLEQFASNVGDLMKILSSAQNTTTDIMKYVCLFFGNNNFV